ncbi:serine/threonine-protein kinase [Gordonia humi]|uniref:serine/threonine-protein kinase n=1 Tax=Gordonia humi TaxID=686429 RepID=UPI003608A33F
MDVGSQFGPYRIDALLGRGGMGQVFRAYDTVRDREVALKLLNTNLAEDATFQERFRRESQTAARLGEPHIIPIHDYGEIDGVLYLDMRLVDGRDLRAVLRGDGPMAPSEAVGVVEQIASALDAAHTVGLVHRDVKPENILVTSNGFAYLVDFGIAHHAGDDHLTRTGTAVGSIAYMAPEQLDNVPVSAASDVYSLSAVLFELLTGRQPYPGDSVSAVLKATVLAAVPAPSSISPAVMPALDAVVMRGLAKNPADRFGSAGEFAAAARAAVDGAPIDPAFEATRIGQPIPMQPPVPSTRQMSEPMSFSGPAGLLGASELLGSPELLRSPTAVLRSHRAAAAELSVRRGARVQRCSAGRQPGPAHRARRADRSARGGADRFRGVLVRLPGFGWVEHGGTLVDDDRHEHRSAHDAERRAHAAPGDRPVRWRCRCGGRGHHL